MLKRRVFLQGVVCCGAFPTAVLAQGADPTVGFLNGGKPENYAAVVSAFRKGLSEMGYVEGRNLKIEFRWGMNDLTRQPELASELVSRKVDVIATPGSVNSALAAKALTNSIPVVFSTSGDPVKLGLVESLSHPGGNVTGFNDMSSELLPKHIALLQELLPDVQRIGALIRPANPWTSTQIRDGDAAAQAAGTELKPVFASGAAELSKAFEGLQSVSINALSVSTDIIFMGAAKHIVDLAAHYRIPTIYPARSWVEIGGLMSYGPSETEQGRQAGLYVGRILKGEKPSNMPVLQSRKFDLVISLKAARSMGVSVPASLLAFADEVFE